MTQERKQQIYRTIMLVILTAFITFMGTTIYFNKYNPSNGNQQYVVVSDKEAGISGELSKLRPIVEKYFLGEIDENKLRDETIRGYINGLDDEYSEYITKEEFEDFSAAIMGNYVGIGIYMAKSANANEIIILAPIKGSPAEAIGLLPGDVILKVDGLEYTGDELTVASNKIKGTAGTPVILEVRRDTETKEYEIIREKVVVNPIETKILDNNIGYIQVVSFDEGCSEQFKTKFEALKAQGITSLIIDLRNNGGGIVREALNIANYVIPKDKVLLITVNKTDKEAKEIARLDPIIEMPVVVLVNENSASASEILAGALKDHEMAKLVGTKTYGKGVIQEVMRLTDGSALKLTTEEYFTPNNIKIDKIGIEPDEKVELPEGVKPSYTIPEKDDTQLKKAIELLK